MAMKGDVEAAVSSLDFAHVVILRPGLIVGDRQGEARLAEGALRVVARGLAAVSNGALADFWAQDAAVIARAAVTAGLLCIEGKAPAPEKKVWILEQKEILRYGRPDST